jgi:hypothetical protein
MFDKIVAIVLVVATAVFFVNASIEYLADHLNILGAFVALGSLCGGLMVVRSVIRDRL